MDEFWFSDKVALMFAYDSSKMTIFHFFFHWTVVNEFILPFDVHNWYLDVIWMLNMYEMAKCEIGHTIKDAFILFEPVHILLIWH